ncbi:MAG: hypothetical protein ACREEM_11350, partial [Blastocatellia bacterium]
MFIAKSPFVIACIVAPGIFRNKPGKLLVTPWSLPHNSRANVPADDVAASKDETMKTCPQCRTAYDPHLRIC